MDVDPQRGFSSQTKRKELPVEGAAQIVGELECNKHFSLIHTASKEAHPHNPKWKATLTKPQGTEIHNKPNLDRRWNIHCQVGTVGAEFLRGMPKVTDYDYIAYKGMEREMHPYGACFHDLDKKISTGLIEFLTVKGIKLVVVGGLATDYCVKNTVLELRHAGFDVIVNLASCRGIAADTTKSALFEMKGAGAVIVKNSKQLKKYIY